ncbi:MAG: efflux RND transporter periplasmic adaptor subunit [Proteobacteria bacterium]|nr:efflux RND transporter periplasmic adaptor subunit [Pseudomonadota bacterium]
MTDDKRPLHESAEPVSQDVHSADDRSAEPVSSPATGPEKKPPRRLFDRIVSRSAVALAITAAFAVGVCTANDDAPAPPAEHEHTAEQVWTCPMHPQIRTNQEGNCPICGMALVRVEQSEQDSDSSDPGRITLNQRAKTLAQIQTVAVEPYAVSGKLHETRLLGRVDYDETRVKTVTAWTAGRIDRLLVATTGQRIARGQVIARLYSPEMYSAQSDLIEANRQLARLAGAGQLTRSAARSALDSARQRLRLLGLSEPAIAAVEKAGTPSQQVAIRSPVAGTVIARLLDEGHYVKAGTALYRVADLARLWVQLEAYESDIARLAVGDRVDLTITGLSGTRVEGWVAFIDPVVDTRRRIIRVRVEVANRDGALRPGMFAEATLRGPANDNPGRLMIPETAPLFTGTRSVVYVEVPSTERPTYQAREVTLGDKIDDAFPVLSGLELGERVVTRGAFVIDADLQIKGGASMMAAADDRMRAGGDIVTDIPGPLGLALAAIVTGYLDVQSALAADDFERAMAKNQALTRAVTQAVPRVPHRLRAIWDPLAVALASYSRKFAESSDIEAARRAFEGLSNSAIELVSRLGNASGETVRLAYCPMAFDGRGASWLQRGETINNAYFGAAMLTCGEVRGEVAPGGHLGAADNRSTPAEQQPTPAAGAAGHQH